MSAIILRDKIIYITIIANPQTTLQSFYAKNVIPDYTDYIEYYP